MLDQRLNVNRNCLLDIGGYFFQGVAGRYASRKIWYVGAVVRASTIYNNGVLAHRGLRSSPACLTMLATVGFESSTPRAPGTVTEPLFSPCLKIRWLPVCLTWSQPSSLSSFIIARTFTTTKGREEFSRTANSGDRHSSTAFWYYSDAPLLPHQFQIRCPHSDLAISRPTSGPSLVTLH